VSPKAIPQMQDTAAVYQLIYRKQKKVSYWPYNTRGAQIASTHAEIQYLGYPFSISETFRCGTLKTIAESLVTLDEILEIADKTNKKVVFIYGFWKSIRRSLGRRNCGGRLEKLSKMGVKILSLSDTVGIYS
jgi:hydroxymethylglutaryl-CoA lyase